MESEHEGRYSAVALSVMLDSRRAMRHTTAWKQVVDQAGGLCRGDPLDSFRSGRQSFWNRYRSQ